MVKKRKVTKGKKPMKSLIKKVLSKVKRTKKKAVAAPEIKGAVAEVKVEVKKELLTKTAKEFKFSQGIKVFTPVTTTVAAIEDKYYRHGEHIIPSELVCTAIVPYYSGFTEIRYYQENMTIKSIVVTDNFMLQEKEVTSELTRKIFMKDMFNMTNDHPNVGSDPEIFVVDGKDNLIPAFKFLPAKPGSNVKRTEGDHRPIYWDGFQAEFETRPNTCFAFHVDAIQAQLSNLTRLATKHDKTAKLSIKTVMDIPEDELKNAKDEHINFGCMPSLNVYGLEGNKRPGREVNFRPVGGHIHFGFGKQEPDAIERSVKALDAIAAVACVSLFAELDDPRRRTLYGLPGEYRLPSHGMEYRTLSNAWLCHPVAAHLTLDLSRRAMNLGRKDLFKYLDWTADQERTIKTILESDVKEARKIMAENKAAYLAMFKANYGDQERAEAAYSAFLQGIESIIKDPTDLVSNWNLDKDWRTHSESDGKAFSNAYRLFISKKQKVA
jgi:hypothetical protein